MSSEGSPESLYCHYYHKYKKYLSDAIHLSI